MKFTAIMLLVTTLGGLGWEGRFNSSYVAAAQGQIGTAALEFTSAMRQALRDQDIHHNTRPQIR